MPSRADHRYDWVSTTNRMGKCDHRKVFPMVGGLVCPRCGQQWIRKEIS